MAKASGPIVGLDIGSSFIKVAELAFRQGRPEVIAVGLMPTPPDAVIQGLVIDPPALGLIIKHLIEISGIRAKRVISSVAGANNVAVRIVEVPKMSEKELGDTMKFEIDRFVPFAHGQEIERAFQSLPVPATSDANIQVLLAVAVQDVVTAHLQAVRAAGLEPVAVEVEPVAVARALTAFAEDGHPLNETVGIVNLGAASTELSIVTGGLLIFPRTISIGGDSFTKAIAENLGLRVDAAERLKRQYAAVDMDRVAAAQSSSSFGDGSFSDFASSGEGDSPFGSSFDFNSQSPAVSAAPGLNPFLYGGPGAAPSPSAAGARPGDVPGFAPPSEEDSSVNTGSIFDLGSDAGGGSPLFGGGPGGGSPFEMGFAGGPDSTFGGGPDGIGAAPSFGGGAASPEDEEAQMAKQVQDVLSPVLGELVTELRRSLEYYRSHNEALPLARLILCGGSAKIPNLCQFLETELGISVSIADPLAHTHIIPTFESSASREWLQDVAPLFPVAIGLAEREMVAIPKDYVPKTLTSAS